MWGFSILHSVWQSVTLSLFHLFSSATIVCTQTNSQSAIYSSQMNCLPWEPEVSALIFLLLCRISMTTDTEITLCARRGRGCGGEGEGGKKGPGDTTQWHFCGTWGEPGSFRQAGQGWVFTLLKREDLAWQKRRRPWPEMWCGPSQ